MGIVGFGYKKLGDEGVTAECRAKEIKLFHRCVCVDQAVLQVCACVCVCAQACA